MKRLLILILGVMLLMPVNVLAEGKSIQPFNSTSNISNNGLRIKITYEQKSAYVYYGSDGINIITDKGIKHLDTNFEVLKLVDTGDVDGDGYTDFLTYQKAPEYTYQVITVNGKDGHIISGSNFTHQGFDNNRGMVNKNSYIMQLLPLYNGEAMVIYDYEIVKIDLKTGAATARYAETDNIWKAALIDDITGDGVSDVAYVGQQNVLGLLDGTTLEVIRTDNLSQNYEISPQWDPDRKGTAVMNLWDLYYENGFLYVTSEDGYLYRLTPGDEMMKENMAVTPLEVVAEDTLKQLLSNQINYYTDHVEYRATGVQNWTFMGYKIVDHNDRYLLINCYMGDMDGTSEWPDSNYPPTAVLVDKETMEVKMRQAAENFSAAQLQTCMGEYEGQTVVVSINGIDEQSIRMYLYDTNGEIVTQKEVPFSMTADRNRLFLSRDGKGYVLEMIGNGVTYLDSNMKITGYAYETYASSMVSSNGGNNIFVYSTNGQKDRIVCYGSDLKTVKWSFTLPKKYNSHGIENLVTDQDYNKDGQPDMMFVINHHDKKDNPVKSIVYVLNGKTGAALWSNAIVSGQYQNDKGKTITTYLLVNSIKVLADYDKDGKKELSLDGTVVSSKTHKIIGSISAGVDSKGVLYEVGDINKDGAPDYVAVTKSEARVYLSHVTNTDGFVSNEYKKTKTAISLNSKMEPQNYTIIFGDVNRDGIQDLGMPDRNKENHEVFKVISGKNLQTIVTLCPEGVHDTGEAFSPLDYDLNGDGYNEIYGRRNWGLYGIYDGHTGERLVRTTYSAYDEKYMEEDKGMENYYPDYIVPFYRMDETPNFILINDINNDRKKDLAISRYSINEDNWQSYSYIELVETGQFNVENQIIYSTDASFGGGLVAVENSDRYILLSTGETCTLIDLDGQKILASYAITPISGSLTEDGRILIRDNTNQLYFLDTEPSFDLVSEIPETTSEHVIHLQWQPRQDYSVMTVSDNGNTVYVGPQTELDLPLIQGDHHIILSMDDGQGKSYQESYDVSVASQPVSYYWVIGVAAAALLLSFLLGINQKLSVRRRYRKEASR